MKFKLNLNVDGLKPLAIQHGEKAVFGLGVLLLLMFVWAAAKTDVLGPEKQQDKLKEAAEKSDQWVLGSKWNPKAKGVEVADYVMRSKRDPLNDKDYRLTVFFDKPLWESKGLRPDPKILAVEEVRASAGLGIFAIRLPEQPPEVNAPAPRGRRERQPGNKPAGPMGPGQMPGPGGNTGTRLVAGAQLKGLSWLAVTGLVPVAKQETEFAEAFHNVKYNDPDKDQPQYYGLRIERAEVDDASAAPAWQPINLTVFQKTLKSFASSPRELVDELYIDPDYTMPLGPLVGAEWSPDDVGHPKVKVAERPEVRQQRPADADVESTGDEDEDAAGGFGAKPKEPKNFGPPQNLAQWQKKRPSRTGGPSRRKTDYTLFRVIDYTVEPGKQYRYRVQLRLENPNYDQAEKWLKDKASKTKKVVDSPWSEPTPAVRVPRDVELFAGAVLKSGVREPLAKVLIKKLDRDRGLQLRKESTFARGSLINIDKPKIEIDGVEITDALLDSNSVLIDVRGGRPLSIKDKLLTEPTELLILQPDGGLVVRDELDDEESYRDNQDTEAPKGKKVDSPALPPGANPYDDMKKPKAHAPKAGREKKPPKVPRTPNPPKPAKQTS